MKKIFIVTLTLLLAVMSVNAADKAQKKGTVVELKTEFGTMKILLYDDTPQHRDNFLKLVNQGFYDSLLFHRVIKEFMIQGGDPDSKNAPASKQLGAGDVGYTIPAEFVYPKYYHKKGALAAARQGDQVNPEKRSSGCQFYIVQGKKMNDAEIQQMEKILLNKAKEKRFYEIAREKNEEIKKLRIAKDQEGLRKLNDDIIAQLEKEFESKASDFKMPDEMKEVYKTIGGTPFLDNDYTVFGEVIEGLEVIDAIAAVKTRPGDRPENDIKMSIKVVK
ncbi:MAG: peptidylprolyl isomerase [Paludibacteraceae bacterium]|nr:peptidylprolyl isomerase [Paludibacteraceae bacterium]